FSRPAPAALFLPLFSLRDSPFVFFFTATATTQIYTLSLHDALPISAAFLPLRLPRPRTWARLSLPRPCAAASGDARRGDAGWDRDRKSTRLNSSHLVISYAVFCLKKKKTRADAQMIFARLGSNVCTP